MSEKLGERHGPVFLSRLADYGVDTFRMSGEDRQETRL